MIKLRWKLDVEKVLVALAVLGSRVVVSLEHPLGGQQPLNPYGPAGMDATSGYSNFSSESKTIAVSKSLKKIVKLVFYLINR